MSTGLLSLGNHREEVKALNTRLTRLEAKSARVSLESSAKPVYLAFWKKKC
jgi:hypothetical protein